MCFTCSYNAWFFITVVKNMLRKTKNNYTDHMFNTSSYLKSNKHTSTNQESNKMYQRMWCCDLKEYGSSPGMSFCGAEMI